MALFVLWAAAILAQHTPSKPLVVLDPGHGGHLVGARGTCGLEEKSVTLAISKELGVLLEASGRVDVALTRNRDEHLPLEARTAFANRMGAALFLSVHANASPRERSRGVETFFLSRGAASRWSLSLAERENEGHIPQVHSSEDELDTILRHLHLTAAHSQSQRFAIGLQRTLAESLNSPGRGVLQAPFVVLQGATMPAALVEVGFLTNPEECQSLATAEYRETIARALSTAILAHLHETSSLALR